jgi:hypothetical protein
LGYVLEEVDEEVEGVEHVDVLLEVLRVRGVKQYAAFERLIADLLRRHRRTRDVFGQTLLRRMVEYANAVVDAEARMLQGQEVSGKVFIQQLAFYQELDFPTPEDLDHRLEPVKRYAEEGTLLIKATLQNDGMEVAVPPHHVPKRLVRYDRAGEQRSAGALIVELPEDVIDQTRNLGEQSSIMAKMRAPGFE